jgi:hypothetical protein
LWPKRRCQYWWWATAIEDSAAPTPSADAIAHDAVASVAIEDVLDVASMTPSPIPKDVLDVAPKTPSPTRALALAHVAPEDAVTDVALALADIAPEDAVTDVTRAIAPRGRQRNVYEPMLPVELTGIRLGRIRVIRDASPAPSPVAVSGTSEAPTPSPNAIADDAVSGTSEAPTPSPNEADEAIAHDTVANLADVAPDDAVAAANWTDLDEILFE